MGPWHQLYFSSRQKLRLKRKAAPNQNVLLRQPAEVFNPLLFSPTVEQPAEYISGVPIERHLTSLPARQQEIRISLWHLGRLDEAFVVGESHHEVMIRAPQMTRVDEFGADSIRLRGTIRVHQTTANEIRNRAG